ncbi:MAG: tetratricopeptide repeat protein [Deltaproteobacteria bacterium]|nr:tetratricopeptide repeat protein [Deltaproteobacteria bacterium]
MGKEAVAEEFFQRGEELLAGGDKNSALECFRQAYRIDPSLARYCSAYGLGIALVERRFKYAKGLCEQAVKTSPKDPKLRHNLARVYLCFGFRAEGIRVIGKGLEIDPDYRPLFRELRKLGFRRPPVIPFLGRSNLINRMLGKLRTRLGVGRSKDQSLQALSNRV